MSKIFTRKLPICPTPSDIYREMISFLSNDKNIVNLLSGRVQFPMQVNLNQIKRKSDLLTFNQELRHFLSAWKIDDSKNKRDNGSFDDKLLHHAKWEIFFGVSFPSFIIFESLDDFLSYIPENHQIHNLVGYINYLKSGLEQTLQHSIQPILFSSFSKEVASSLIGKSRNDVEILLQTLVIIINNKSNGSDKYLRHLDIGGIPTKYIEQNIKIIETIMRYLLPDFIDLVSWLDLNEKPQCWILSAIPDLSIDYCRIDVKTLEGLSIHYPVLIIENEEPIYTLGKLNLPLFIFGGKGKNLDWISSIKTNGHPIYYWGDIDADGLLMLSLAKEKNVNIQPFLMDLSTFETLGQHTVDDTTTLFNTPSNLDPNEVELFNTVRVQGLRLEQEKIPISFVLNHLKDIFESNHH